MAESAEKGKGKWTTTIIISSSLKEGWPKLLCLPSLEAMYNFKTAEETHGSVIVELQSCEVATALENRSHKVRYSNAVESGSIIFSCTGVAFLLMDAKECFMLAEEIFLAKIEKFINIHQNSFLILSAAFHGPEEWKLMFRIQQRFLGSKLRILPVHNTINAVNLMCTIAKITSKPYIESICYRMIATKAYIIEHSPVWKTLQKINLSDSFNPN